MAWDYDRCVSVLKREIDLFKRISPVQDSLRKAVMAREWVDFDGKIACVNRLGEEFRDLEAERAEVFAALGRAPSESGGDFSFYGLAAKLPREQSRELTALYRELKMETLKMKALNETFLNYLNEVKHITSAWMETAFPVQGGKLYTRMGRQVSQDLRSMIFSRRI